MAGTWKLCTNLTTSRLCRTPPKNYFVIFKRRVIALFGTIVPPKISMNFQEESWADAWKKRDFLDRMKHKGSCVQWVLLLFSQKNRNTANREG